jgi:hypothetical protein
MSVMRLVLALALAVVAAGCGAGTPRQDGGGDAPDVSGGRHGPVRLVDHSLEDDGGRFNALGASMFWAPWGYKLDRSRLESELQYLADRGFHYIRALGVVGDPVNPDSWDGREIDEAWPDYDAVIAGLTDLAYDRYGLRVQWTLIGDGQVAVPTEPERYALADRFLAMAASRRDKIILFEIANEYYQNGFDGADGLAQLRALARYMSERTDILVAASAPTSADCGAVQEVYGGDVADIATIHFSRTTDQADGVWRPSRMPWDFAACTGVPVGANNEPIGPGSSVTSIDEVPPLAAAPLVTWVSGLPMHVFHSSAGVRGFEAFADMIGIDAQHHLMALAPGDLASWPRTECGDAESPFRCYARDGTTWVADAMWPELGNPTGGAVRVYTATSGDAFFTVAIGVRAELQLEALRALQVDVVDPITNQVIGSHTLVAGEIVLVGDGREVVVVRGTSR